MRFTICSIFIIIFFMACDKGDDGSPEYLPPLSGVTTLEMSFGAENIPDEYIIFRVRGISVTHQGDICISQGCNVIVYDSNGNPKVILGHEGQGPGDFREARNSNVSSAGYLSVKAGKSGIFNIYSPQLDFIKTENLQNKMHYSRFISEMSRGSLNPLKLFAVNENDKVITCTSTATSYKSPFYTYDMLLYEKNGKINLLADYNSKSRVRAGRLTSEIPFFGGLNCAMLTGNRIIYTHADHDFTIENDHGYYFLHVVSLDNLSVKQIKHRYSPIKITKEIREKYNFSSEGEIGRLLKKACEDKKYYPHIIGIYTDRNFAFVFTSDFRDIDGRREFPVDIFNVDTGKYIRSAYMGGFFTIRDGYAYTVGLNEEGFEEIQKLKIDPAVYGK